MPGSHPKRFALAMQEHGIRAANKGPGLIETEYSDANLIEDNRK